MTWSPYVLHAVNKKIQSTNKHLMRVWLGVVAEAYNPSILEGQGGQIIEGQEFETSLTNIVKPHLY